MITLIRHERRIARTGNGVCSRSAQPRTDLFEDDSRGAQIKKEQWAR
jgi:hypothetical protein